MTTSLQRALSELDLKSKGSSSEDDFSISPRSSASESCSKKGMVPFKSSSSLQREMEKLKANDLLEQYDRQAQVRGKKADDFLEQYERQAQLRGKMRL